MSGFNVTGTVPTFASDASNASGASGQGQWLASMPTNGNPSNTAQLAPGSWKTTEDSRAGRFAAGDRVALKDLNSFAGSKVPDEIRSISTVTIKSNGETARLELFKRHISGNNYAYVARERDSAGKASPMYIYLGNSSAGDTAASRSAAGKSLQNLLASGLIVPQRVGLSRAVPAASTRLEADRAAANKLAEHAALFESIPSATKPAAAAGLKERFLQAVSRNRSGFSDGLKSASQKAFDLLFKHEKAAGFANLDSARPSPASAAGQAEAILKVGTAGRLELNGTVEDVARLKAGAEAVAKLPGHTGRQRMDFLVDKGWGGAISGGLANVLMGAAAGAAVGKVADAALKPIVVRLLAKKWGEKAVLGAFGYVGKAAAGASLLKDIYDVTTSVRSLIDSYKSAGAKGLKTEDMVKLSEVVLKEVKNLSQTVGKDAVMGITAVAPRVLGSGSSGAASNSRSSGAQQIQIRDVNKARAELENTYNRR